MRFVFVLTALFWVTFQLHAQTNVPAQSAAYIPPEVISREEPVYPAELAAKDIGGKVVVEFIITAKGAVKDARIVSSTDAAFNRSALRAARYYKFKPAERDGKAVESRAVLPITFAIRGTDPSPGQRVTVSHMPPLEYPEGMSAIGVKADVLVGIVVSTDGTVLTAEIINSNNPAFNDSALKTALKMRLVPRLENGKPVIFRATQPFSFRIGGMRDSGNNSYGITPPKDLVTGKSTTPSITQIKNVALAVFPYSLLGQTKTGMAEVLIMIDGKGHIAGVKILEASAPEFGFAAAAAAETFVFDPAPTEQKDQLRQIRYTLNFTDRKDNGTSGIADMALLKQETKKPESISKGNNLDQPLKLLSRRSPPFPRSVSMDKDTGEAVIEFLVDEKGNVALPRIISATSPEFGYAGVQAVSSWRFDPPTAQGKKAIVRVRQPFAFKRDAASGSPTP